MFFNLFVQQGKAHLLLAMFGRGLHCFLNPSVEHNGLLGALDPFFELNLMKFINAEPVPGFSELIPMKISVPAGRI